MPFRQVTIIGTGLIGGSFALGIRKHGFAGRIIGCDRKEVLAEAKSRGAIDDGVSDPVEACAGSDLILLATPVGAILELLPKIAPHLVPDALVTDVGSTKAEIVRRASEAWGEEAGRCFLAGHPMAGKENSGIEYADPELFRGAVWFLTPVEEQNLERGKLALWAALLTDLGARISVLDPSQHDELCAWISHLPQMISTALAATLVEEFGDNAPLLETGGRALRDMTRIAASPYSMWRDIALTNKKPIADALAKLEQELAHIRENLGTRELEAEFERAHRLRSSPPGSIAAENRAKKK